METFLARQPIFDASQHVYGYELLFRSGFKNSFDPSTDPTLASSKVIVDSAFLLGIDSITSGRKAFINITRDLLLSEYLTLLPPDRFVLEILEDIEPDDEVFAACERLKRQGYTIALDDYTGEELHEPLLDLADIVKLDLPACSQDDLGRLLEKFNDRGIETLAEKVETKTMYDQLANMGFHYFQGYFFSKPIMIAAHDIPGNKLHHLALLAEINRRDLNLAEIEAILKRELALSFKLLKYINSAAFGVGQKVTSIRRAILLLGPEEIRKWASLLLLSSLGEDQPDELVRTALIRGRACESLAECCTLAGRCDECFLMGMFSLLDAITSRPLEEMLAQLPMATDVHEGLLGSENRFFSLLQCVISHERGNWDALDEHARKADIEPKIVAEHVCGAVEWTDGMAGATAAAA